MSTSQFSMILAPLFYILLTFSLCLFFLWFLNKSKERLIKFIYSGKATKNHPQSTRYVTPFDHFWTKANSKLGGNSSGSNPKRVVIFYKILWSSKIYETYYWHLSYCFLTHLTWLIHTSFLLSKWNLYLKLQFLA